MKKVNISAVLFLVVVLLMVEVRETAPPPPPVTCNPEGLQVCLPAITFGTTPSQSCCDGLKKQEPCFCQYINNPDYKSYVDSPNARKAAASCGITIPTTC